MTNTTDDTPTKLKPKRGPGRPKGLGRVPGSGRKRGTPNRDYLFAERYGRAPDQVASVVVVSTLIAILVLPALLAYLL